MDVRVAIADDAAFIREIIRYLSRQQDFVIVGEADDGEAAIQMALATKPDVILMDMVLPKKSGIEATRAILAVLPETKIIACSTIDQEMILVQALDAGCCDYIAKPFDSDQVGKAIRRAMGAA